MDFWQKLDELAKGKIVIDRPKGKPHPKYPDFIYPVDYGYVEGTTSSDGHEIDIFAGSSQAKKVTGILCTFDANKKDMEAKVLFACTSEEEKIILHALNIGFMSSKILKRNK